MTVMRSKSVQGLSSVQLIFDQGTDVLQARQMVTERVAVVAPTLPERGRNPRVLPPLSSTSRVLKVGLTSRQADAAPSCRSSPSGRWSRASAPCPASPTSRSTA